MKEKISFIEGCMRHSTMVKFIIVCMVALGVWGLWKMPKQEFPEFIIRQGLVVAIYPGASPEQMEAQVAKPLEEFLFTFKEVNKNKTYTLSNNGIVYAMVELEEDVRNKDEFWSKFKHSLALFKSQLPAGVAKLLALDDFGDTSALLISLESETLTHRQIEDYVTQLEGELRKIPSVSNLRRFGIQKEQISVMLDHERLAAYSIDTKQLSANLFSQGLTTASGVFTHDQQRIPLYFAENYNSQEEVANLVIYSDPTGKVVQLKDIATVKREYEPHQKNIKSNAKQAVVLSMEMRQGFNIVDFGKQVDQALETFSAIQPEDLIIRRIVDQPKVVNESVVAFLRDLGLAIIIVILVMILLFPLRSALIASTTIPLTIFIAVGIMYLVDIPLNTVTLSALILVLGMVVDNAIVVIDAFLEYLRQGVSRWEAAVRSAKDYAGAIFLATLSICIIFFPTLKIFRGQWYDFVQDFPWAFSICLMISFGLAMCVIPYLAHKYIHISENGSPNKQDRFLKSIEDKYENILSTTFNHPFITLGISGLFIGVCFWMASRLDLQMLPAADRNQFAVEIYLPRESSLDQTEQVADSLYALLQADERIEQITSFIGMSSPRFHTVYAPNITAGDHYSQFIVNTESNQATIDLLDELTPKYQEYFSNAFVRFKQLSYQRSTTPVEVRLTGNDTDLLKAYADSVIQVWSKIEGLTWIHTNYEHSYPALELDLDPVQAARLGISKTAAELAMASQFSELPVGKVWEGDYALNVVLQSEANEKTTTLDELENRYVRTVTGQSIPLRQIAEVKPIWKDAQLVRHNGVKSISIMADVKRGFSSSNVQKVALASFKDEIAPLLPLGMGYAYGGAYEADSEIIPQVAQVILVGIFLIFLFLLINYKKISISLVALGSLIFSIPGALLGLWLTNTPMGLTGVLGVISLMGISIRNTIMIFDHAQHLIQNQGFSVKDAAYDAGKRRMVPIFLTSATTAIGIIPMIMGQTLLWTPMGIVIFFGTIASMILIITTLPVVYWKIFEKKLA